jgi:hypothetical protein
MKLTKLSVSLSVAFLLIAASAHAELKRVEMSVFGMD